MSAAPRAAFFFAVALAACGRGYNYTQTDPARGIPAESTAATDAGGGAAEKMSVRARCLT